MRRFGEENGYSPSLRDIMAGCGISSTSVASYNLNALEAEGHLKRRPGLSRGIRLLSPSPRFGVVEVPVIGRIAAGEPVPVPAPDTWGVSAGAETVAVAGELTRGREGIYALRVKGSSMVDALVSDGDIVLMQYVNVVENGEMAAVWLKAEQEATLKKVYTGPGRVRLQPANSQMRPIYVAPENVEIQGRVIGVIRGMV
jgi:repressor LexA